MTYRIEYFYRTGNSFGSHMERETLELSWQKREVAEANLQRIKEHYKYYKLVNDRYLKDEEVDEAIAAVSDKDWYVPSKGRPGYDHYDHYCLILKTDKGLSWQIHAPWCGYFESLFSAQIVGENSRIEFD